MELETQLKNGITFDLLILPGQNYYYKKKFHHNVIIPLHSPLFNRVSAMMDGKSASRISFCLLITNMVLAFYQSHPGVVSLIQVKLPSLCFMYFLELFLICSYDSNARFVSSQDVYSSWLNCSTEN